MLVAFIILVLKILHNTMLEGDGRRVRLGVCFRREVGVTSHENRKSYRHPETPSGDLLPGKTPREVAGSFWCLVGTKWEVLILALLTTPRQVGGT